jgi:plastocyanin
MHIKSLILPTLAALAVGAAGYQLADHGTTTSSGPVSSVPVAGRHASVRIVNYSFLPPTLTIKVGTRVTWGNKDATAHTATADQGSFDTGTLNKGQRMTITFNKPGTFTYHCEFHAFMTGTIKVVS